MTDKDVDLIRRFVERANPVDIWSTGIFFQYALDSITFIYKGKQINLPRRYDDGDIHSTINAIIYLWCDEIKQNILKWEVKRL